MSPEQSQPIAGNVLRVIPRHLQNQPSLLTWQFVGERGRQPIKNTVRPLHENHFTSMLRRLKAPTVGKIVLNRSFISINSLIPCVFALPKSELIFRAKVSLCMPLIP